MNAKEKEVTGSDLLNAQRALRAFPTFLVDRNNPICWESCRCNLKPEKFV